MVPLVRIPNFKILRPQLCVHEACEYPNLSLCWLHIWHLCFWNLDQLVLELRKLEHCTTSALWIARGSSKVVFSFWHAVCNADDDMHGCGAWFWPDFSRYQQYQQLVNTSFWIWLGQRGITDGATECWSDIRMYKWGLTYQSI